MKAFKFISFITIFALCLSITCTAAAGHKKHKTKKNTKPSITVEAKNTSKATAPVNGSSTTSAAEAEKPKPPEKPKVVLPYVVLDDNMSNIQTEPTKPVYDKYTVLERQAKGLPTALPQLTPYKNGKIAYLTFDDGPEGKNTPAILDILKNAGVKGTFYVLGSQCYDYPDVVKRIFNEGHALGNHTYCHNYDLLYPNVDNFLNDIYKTEKALREIIGCRPLIIRAPGGTYGMFTSEYYPALKAVGLVEHDWNLCIDDSVGGHPTAVDFVEKIRQQSAWGYNTAIVLMHCTYGKEETVKALPEIIQVLRERSYSFGVMTPMTPQPW